MAEPKRPFGEGEDQAVSTDFVQPLLPQLPRPFDRRRRLRTDPVKPRKQDPVARLKNFDEVSQALTLREAGLTGDEIVLALIRAPIEPGAPADLIVLGDDPLRDLAAFDDIRLVVRAGRVAPQPAFG